ncbi:hypothetical protein BdWA1_002577 [Babesia duncani]|uniref:Uncharacterized protein n=1 Tax=Babesia duncani TaxID=323732 RepID=A0AAD9PJR4_9APIC|nr:hypothetical protein BdWA1_002577 [Babesia duncani]
MEYFKEKPSKTSPIVIGFLVMLSLVAIGMAITLILLYTDKIQIPDGSEYRRGVSIDMDTGLFILYHKDSKNLADALLHRIAIGIGETESEINQILEDYYIKKVLVDGIRVFEVNVDRETNRKNTNILLQKEEYEKANAFLISALEELSVLKGIFVPCLPAIVEIIGMNKDAFDRMVGVSGIIWKKILRERGKHGNTPTK